MLILSASNLGLTNVDQLDEGVSLTFYGQQFSLFRSHQSRYAAIATCRKFLEQGGLALVVMHEHEDDNSVWQMISPDQAKSRASHQVTMEQVVSRVKDILNTKVF